MLVKITLKDSLLLSNNVGIGRILNNLPSTTEEGLEIKTKAVIEISDKDENSIIDFIRFINQKYPFLVDSIVSDDYLGYKISKILPRNYVSRVLLNLYNEVCFVVCFRKDFLDQFEKEFSMEEDMEIITGKEESFLMIDEHKENESNFYKKLREYSKEKKVAFFDNNIYVWYFIEEDKQ